MVVCENVRAIRRGHRGLGRLLGVHRNVGVLGQEGEVHDVDFGGQVHGVEGRQEGRLVARFFGALGLAGAQNMAAGAGY